MAEKIIELKTSDFGAFFVKSRRVEFQKERLFTLMFVLFLYSILISIIVASSIWTIPYIEEPIRVNIMPKFEVPVWLGGGKAVGVEANSSSEIRREKVDVRALSDLNYEIRNEMIYLPEEESGDTGFVPLDLDFGEQQSYFLPDKPIDFNIPEPKDIKREPVWITKGQQPRVVLRVQPEYPEIARLARLEGEVSLEAVIDENGNVESVKIIQSTNNLFNEAAIKAALLWRFESGKINNRPVKAYFILKIRFRLVNNR